MGNVFILEGVDKLFHKLEELIFQNLKYKISERLILVYCHDNRLTKELKKLPVIETLGYKIFPTVKSYNNGNQSISVKYIVGKDVINVCFIQTNDYKKFIVGRVFQSAIVLNPKDRSTGRDLVDMKAIRYIQSRIRDY